MHQPQQIQFFPGNRLVQRVVQRAQGGGAVLVEGGKDARLFLSRQPRLAAQAGRV